MVGGGSLFGVFACISIVVLSGIGWDGLIGIIGRVFVLISVKGHESMNQRKDLYLIVASRL